MRVAALGNPIDRRSKMPDDLTQRGGRDRQRIDIDQEHELRSWSEKFGVTKERLKEAVQAVGDRAEKVQEYLRGGGERAGGSSRER
jgi:hypothetical protein